MMAEVSPTVILKSIGGINFPATKQQILEHVKKNAGEDADRILQVLNRIDDKEYEGPNEILKEVGEVE